MNRLTNKADFWFQDEVYYYADKAKHLYQPETHKAIQRKIKENQELLLRTFLDHRDAAKLGKILQELIDNISASEYYDGLREGFTKGRQYQKLWKKKLETYETEIVKIVAVEPYWRTRRILEELDEREIPFVRLGRLPKNEILRWSDCANKPAYKMLVSRTIDFVQHLGAGQALALLMEEHAKLYGNSGLR